MDHEQWLEQHDHMLADHDRMIADMREAHEKMREDHERMREAHEKLERFHKRTERLLRLAIRAGMRAKAEIDHAITKVAAAQLITEEKLQRLIERDERRYGGNGGH